MRRLRSAWTASLEPGKRFVEEKSSGHERIDQHRTEIALQISGHHDQIEVPRVPGRPREVGAPGAQHDALMSGPPDRLEDRIEVVIDAKSFEPGRGEREGVPAATHRDIKGTARRGDVRGQLANPLFDERRWWISGTFSHVRM